MTDFAFQISGDASKADRAIDSVLTRLEAIKRQAAQAAVTPGLDKMAAGFAKLGEALRKEQQALQRTSQLHTQLTAATNPAALAFGKMAEAIQREQQMLERIHGPMQQHAQDLQTLNALMQKGAITAQQYQMATTRTPSVGSYNVAKVGMPGMGGLGGLAATAGAVVGGGAAFSALDDYQNMQNRLRFLAGGDVQKVNSLFAQLQGVAGRTRQSLGATTETFVKVSMATKQMGMSTGETMQFMERLNKAVALSGASSSAASAGLLQLSQGLSAGALRGEEFNSVVEQIPAVAKVIADSLGVTVGQLRLMAQDGKLTGDVVVNAFSKMGASIDKDFGNTLPTVGQHWQAFKDKMTLAIGEMDRALGIANKLGAALAYVGDTLSISSLKSGKGGVFDIANVLTFGQAGRNLEERITREANESTRELFKVYGDLTGTVDDFGNTIDKSGDQLYEWKVEGTGINELKLYDTFNRMNTALAGYNEKQKESAKATRSAVQAHRELFDIVGDIRRRMETEASARRMAGSDAMNANGPTWLQAYQSGGKKMFDTAESEAAQMLEVEKAYLEEQKKAAEAVVEQRRLLTESWHKRIEDIERARDAARELGAAFAPLGNTIRDALMQGELSAKKFEDALKQIAIQMALTGIATGIGGKTGAFLGGMFGVSSTGFPGKAHGGSWLVGGDGGTDSQLVAFRASPNERVTVETPEQQRTGALRGGGSGERALHLHFSNDRRDIVEGLDSRDGERVYAKLSGRFGRR